MKLLNYRYLDKNSLVEFIQNREIINSNSLLIQLFYSNSNTRDLYKVKEELKEILPNASIVGTSTAGVISNGEMLDDNITISFSIFESSTTKSMGYKNLSVDEIIKNLSTDIIVSDTKLLIIFANTFKFNSVELLQKLAKQFPQIVLAGGNAGDDFKFESCKVFSNSENDSDVVVACINSKILNVETKYLLNWQTVGQEMIVTKAVDNIIYEINNKKVLDIYEYYLGKNIADNILQYGREFPLMFNPDGVDVARAPIAVNDDGSLVLAGNIKEGCRVKFGYANIEYIEDYNHNFLLKENEYLSEAIYIYSCSARRSMLNNYLNDELSIINKIAPTSGFITYGEFFHDGKSCSNNLLNITTTYVVLNEHKAIKKVDRPKEHMIKDKRDITLKALTTLIKKTSEDLNENISYLDQFKEIVNNASIISITDKKGIITEVNDNFIKLSGYQRDELIGKSHNVIRDKNMSKEVFKNLWSTIKSGKVWKGIVTNRAKDGSLYYVISEIAPIFYSDGSFREFLSIRIDITELEEYRALLKNELDSSLDYTRQYENGISSMVPIVKTDIDNKINFVNEAFSKISGYKLDDLVGLDCSKLRDKKHISEDDCQSISDEVKKNITFKKLFTNLTEDGSEYITDILFYPIVDKDKNVIEIVQIMHDVSEIYQLNKELTDTQKEVVLTMGAIGETRSKETGLHVKRVAEYSYLLAILYGLNEEEASLLKQASPMHDIGKVGIADNILNKPGKLTKEEFEIMKTHTDLGYEMLKHSQRPILKASAIVARTHHEKWNGSGYPRGLSGEDIPIFGRITAVADVFDALGHDRVYKKAWKLEDILNLLNEEKGKHFDPKIVSLFIENIDNFLKIRDSMQDTF
ncbi:MAG: PAS domain S-box protein [Campylobacterota bacterium]|nr:PAS domain S-box protein [Campylobacterota bacterium]